MSKENVKAFEDLICNSLALQKEIHALGDDLDGIVDLGKQKGYDFLAGELKVYLQEKEVGVHLDDADLEQVAGGNVDNPWPDPPQTFTCGGYGCR